MVAAAAVIVDEGIWREQVFQQAADPLAAIADRAFGAGGRTGRHQLGNAGVGVALGGQADDLAAEQHCVGLDVSQ